MPKMRGIKPETWTDSRFVRLSPFARLLFIGMWNYACDNGHVSNDPMELKLRILPADSVDISDLVEELVSVGVVEGHDGFLKVPNLARHQRIDKRYLTLCDWCEHDEDTTFYSRPQASDTSGARGAHDGGTSGTHDEGRKEGERKEGRKPATQAGTADGAGNAPQNAMAILASLGLITEDLRRTYLAALKDRGIERPTRFIVAQYGKGELAGEIEDWLAERDANNVVALRQPAQHFMNREHHDSCRTCQIKAGGTWDEVHG